MLLMVISSISAKVRQRQQMISSDTGLGRKTNITVVATQSGWIIVKEFFLFSFLVVNSIKTRSILSGRRKNT